MRLVLASASPRRRELLPLLGIPFEVVEPDVEELTEGDPRELVLHNAELKARAGAALAGPGATVLGSDTDVVIDGVVLGKPDDAEQARARIELLAGRTHLVHSGVWVLPPAGRPARTTARAASRRPRSPFASSARPRSRPTSRPASGRAGPAATRCRASARA